ncbi:MAG: recombinase family protein [Planctomycetota bacterium]|nr:recombinase family protein [Planctomycetota bacterium]
MAKKAHSHSGNGQSALGRTERRGRQQKLNTCWLRTPILVPLGQILIVLIYARKSKEEKNQRSIQAQRSYCERFLANLGIHNYRIIFYHDHGISGEEISRPGIDLVRETIDVLGCHLILCEESSRLFRDPIPSIQLCRAAVDKGLRVICLNDYIDTTDEEWEEHLQEAQRHHARANRFTISRILRDQEERWESEAAMGPLRPGYSRKASTPATQREPEQGPFYDEVDPKWTPIIEEAYKRVGGEQDPDSVVSYLDEVRLPGLNGRYIPWNRKRLFELIRSTIYRGVEQFRKTVSRKNRSSGKRTQQRAKPEEMWERDQSEMRIVPDWQWYKANDCISKRSTNKNVRTGPDHPLFGKPRNSQGPLGETFLCDACEEKMYQEGRLEGGYRCSQVRSGDCWCKATALRDLTHEQLAQSVCNKLQDIDGQFHQIIETVRQLGGSGKWQARRIRRLSARASNLDRMCDRLLEDREAIGKHNIPPERLRQRYVAREEELSRTFAEIERLKTGLKAISPPPLKELMNRRDYLVDRLVKLDITNSSLFRQLVAEVRAVPYQLFGGTTVVLRAHFELSLFALLPDRLRAVLLPDDFHGRVQPMQLVIDLFDRPDYLVHMTDCVRVKGDHPQWGNVRISRQLKINKMTTKRALNFAALLSAHGIQDPYLRLTGPPANAARWRKRTTLARSA